MNNYLVKITNKNGVFTTMTTEAENLEDCIHKVFLSNKSLRISSVKTLYVEALKKETEIPTNKTEEKLINEKHYIHCSGCGNIMAPVDDGADVCWDCRLKRGEKSE